MESRLLETEKMTVALVATYPEMAKNLSKMIEGTNIKLLNIHASFDEAVAAAKKIENDVDIILTRGGTGHMIKQAMSIPVISVPITPFDLSVSVATLPEEVKRVGFINFQRPIYGVDKIEKLFGKKIFQYQFINQEDLKRVAAQAKTDRCDIVIGGALGIAYAKELGLRTQEIESGQEAIFQALTEAIELIRVKREEQKQAVRLKAAFDALAEGICIANENGDISVFNPAATRIFRLEDSSVVGKNIRDISPGSLTVDAFANHKFIHNQLESVWNTTLATSHLPIYVQNNFIGMVSTFQDVTKIQRLEGQIRQQLSKKGFRAKYTFQDILTCTPDVEMLKAVAKLYAQTDAAILIEGESGTGKELFAHSIHNASPYALGPFVTINCAAIPEQLLESELFGYAPGAFTGARREGKQGLFELALNGTLFLDEIGEMPKYLQSRLLRALQEKEIMRLGDNKIISINCRIISATNKNLAALVAEGNFREDLYYRLNSFSIKVPPLRERQEDISYLCEHFLSTMGVPQNSEFFQSLVNEWGYYLEDYSWRGNIRELNSFCTRIALLQTVGKNEKVQRYLKTVFAQYRDTESGSTVLTLDTNLPLKEAMEEAESQYILAVLKKHKNNHSMAARQLGIGRTTLWRRLDGRETAAEKEA